MESDDAAFTVGIVVPELAAALAAAVANGGSIVLPATDNGWLKRRRSKIRPAIE